MRFDSVRLTCGMKIILISAMFNVGTGGTISDFAPKRTGTGQGVITIDTLCMSILCRRNEQSLVHYSSRPSVAPLQCCSDVLSRAPPLKSKPSTQLLLLVQKQVLYRQREKPQHHSSRPDCIIVCIQNVQLVLNSQEKCPHFK